MENKLPWSVKLKTNLKMCISRLRYAQEKQQALAKQDRRKVAELLKDNKEQKAHYRVESLIHNDVHMELLELLELYGELLLARLNIVNSIENELALVSNHTEDGINEAIRSLCYCATLYVPEVKELQIVKDLFQWKFGIEFIKLLIDDKIGVPKKILQKCSPDLPADELVVLYLSEIAKTYNVPYSKLIKLDDDDDDDELSSGGNLSEDSTNDQGSGKPIVAVDNDTIYPEANEKHPITIRKARRTSENMEKDLKIPKNIKKDVKSVHSNNETDDLDDLKRRFDALRR